MHMSFVLVALCFSTFCALSVDAGEGKGKGRDKKEHDEEKEHKGKRPPGWSKGNKNGWRGEFPPGWEKKSEKQKDKWFEEYEEAVDKVGRESDKRKVEPAKRDRLQEATERAIRKGKEAKKATEDVIDALKEGIDIEIIIRDIGA
jgi:hypothetical protein